ncbi:Malonyl CoA-acyl carrier protein transacylase [subsurface metagenome]|jgi:[acyl-carrier-protein] S-malonyltransferase
MPKLAFVFPGQGSQEVGMGKDLIENYKEAENLFNEAKLALKDEGIDLKKLCLEGPEEELTKTINAQPAMLTISIILYKLLQKNNINPSIVAGHSLGEYSALVAASSIEFKEAVRLVRKRGQYMQTAIPIGIGSMAAIISLKKDNIEELIKKVSRFGTIEIANYNSPYQIVVSGKSEAIKELLILGEKEEEINIIPLKVSAPFHSSLMRKAKENFASYIENVNIQEPKIPVICNVTADYVKTKEKIKHALIEQVTQPIKWVDIIKRINSEGINYFIEVGPGNVLKKLVKQILPKAKVYNVYDSESLEKVIKKLS